MSRQVGHGRITTQPPYWTPLRVAFGLAYFAAFVTLYLVI